MYLTPAILSRPPFLLAGMQNGACIRCYTLNNRGKYKIRHSDIGSGHAQSLSLTYLPPAPHALLQRGVATQV
ncbi:hypothetical protein KIPB_016486, partial [Kipferlia bialata]|eukprot:g16486.t1